jgi:hypothetical protein
VTLRPLVVFLLSAVFAAALVFAVVNVVLPTTAPAIAPPPPATRPLTRHLALLIVDGLRYDIANDPKLMPRFAAAMQRHTSGEVWAGRVSMTTSAVLSYGSGQHGRLEQIVRNIHPRPPPFNSWLENARGGGLSIVAVGDPAWFGMFGAHIDEHRPDPEGVAIDVDFNPQTFRDTRELLPKKPNFFVSHFVTPDHQGHAYGIWSARYAAHITDYDRQLFELLAEFSPDWTLLVTSDHGAADSGTHGSDTDVQRRSPIFAYGPGIRPGVKLERRLEQPDLAATMAALLGVSPPAHGLGHPIVEWLDVPPEEQARIACDGAEPVIAYGKTLLSDDAIAAAERELAACRAAAPADVAARSTAGRAAARAIDAGILASTGIGSPTALLVAAIVCIAAALLALAALGRAMLPGLLPALLLAAIAIPLVRETERLPGGWPNGVRVILFVTALFPVLLLILFPGRGASFLERRPALAPILIPGVLVATYTTNTQPMAYVALCVGALLFTLLGQITTETPPILRGARPRLGWPHLVVLLLLLGFLFRPGSRPGDVYPAWLFTTPGRSLALALAALALWSLAQLARKRDERAPLVEVALGLPLAAASLLLRDHVPPLAGRACILLLPLVAITAAAAGRRALALHLGIAGYAWVSRNHEIPGLVVTIAIAQAVGEALAQGRREQPARHGLTQTLLLAAFAFGLIYVQRVAIQGGLDFGGMDFGAAGFGDPHVPAWLVGSALGWKYALAAALALGALFARLDPTERERLASALVAVYLGRTAIMVLMLFICGSSFWTALRVLGDIPFALLGTSLAALLWLAVRWFGRREAGEVEGRVERVGSA